MKLYSRILRTGTFMALAAVATACSWTQDSVKTLRNSDTIAVLPCNPERTEVVISPHIKAQIDFGRVFNLISRKDLDFLKRLDYNIDSTFCLAITNSPVSDEMIFRTRCYTVDLPVWTWKQTVDSLGQRQLTPVGSHPSDVIYGVKFILAPEGENTLLSLDLFSNAVVEYRYDTNELALYKTVPTLYQEVGEIYPGRRFSDFGATKERYYFDLCVNNLPNSFLISSSAGEASVKLPVSDLPKHSSLSKDTVNSPYGPHECLVDEEGWVEFGDRAGTKPIYYYDDPNLNSPYIINPFFFFKQNFVIDFPNRKIYLHPHVQSKKRPKTAETERFIDSLKVADADSTSVTPADN